MLRELGWLEAVEGHAAQQHVAAVARLVEEERGLQAVLRAQPVELVVLAQARDVDAELADQPVHNLAELGVFQVDGPAPGEAHRPALVELVALRVAAEVVVVVEDQDPRAGAVELAIVVRGRQAADPAADHHEVVRLVEHARIVEALSLARERVRDLESARVRAAQSRERRRIVRRAIRSVVGERRPWQCEAEPRKSDVMDEVAPGDAAMHAESAVGGVHGAAVCPRP